MNKRFPFTRWGVAFDPVGEYVKDSKGRLGEIVSVRYHEYAPTGWMATVKHFNGEPWNGEIALSALYWIQDDTWSLAAEENQP